uniref:DUF4160 domain-containing protein n=1 Tax=Candidatus Kentrum sp. FW TaxID=2126338 RepID=A0A450TM94_9GAMM|nr:MAG: protein of unknown function (DUF4160) [Candidatus Kentron sp. FW]
MITNMPETSGFYGIIISIFYDEHNPPHFHARYGKDKVAIDISTLEVLEGKTSPRALKMVKEWASQHQRELMRGWKLAQANKLPKPKPKVHREKRHCHPEAKRGILSA